jgi:hypothetical protein
MDNIEEIDNFLDAYDPPKLDHEDKTTQTNP